MSRSLCDPSLRQSTEEGCEFPVGHITRWVRSGDKDVVKMCIVVVSILIIPSFVSPSPGTLEKIGEGL